MAYNKRKHLEANIAALRIAFAPSTVLTPQQREALTAYSGFGAVLVEGVFARADLAQ